ncbi:MAG TPA: hypothetical protein VHM24_11985 [Gemmatimonadaceae bacterium]|nr:hypothetical protein [Gemmatimonadaceae bacterium]
MGNTKSSYRFHCEMEGFPEFLRREWRAIAICGGAFCAAMFAAIVFVEPSFFYSRLSTDPLNYFLKAKQFAEAGNTAATRAVNAPPFPYSAMPGVLRSPFIVLFEDFDDQLRGMQVLNTIIVGALGLLSAYVFSWVHPRPRHRYVIAFSFAFMLLSPVWVANVFLPLADAPFAAFSLAALVVSITVVCARSPLSNKRGAIAGFAALVAIASTLRFTAPLLLVFAAVLANGRRSLHSLPRRFWLGTGAVTLLFLVILVSLNFQAIFGRYLFEPLWFAARGDKPSMIANLLSVALPSQVIPNFQLGFVHPPLDLLYTTKLTESTADIAWTLVGLALSTIMISGLWIGRRRFLPEIAYVLVPLPVLVPILPSTTRYMMSYQPFLWVFFYLGAIALARRMGLLPLLKRPAVVATALAVMMAVVVGLRGWKVAGTASERVLAVTVTSAPAYVAGVGETFQGLRQFLESLPRERTLLIGDPGTEGRWKIIAGRDYYDPDPSLASIVREKDVYLLAECGTLDTCQSWEYYRNKAQQRVLKFGEFQFDSVYSRQSWRAHVEVFRIRNAL